MERDRFSLGLAVGLAIGLCCATAARPDDRIPRPLMDSLLRRRDQIKEWAITCPPESGPFEGQYTTVKDTCWQGDVTCFAGLSCLAARLADDHETAEARCGDVAAAQASDGKWNRGPTWVDKDYPDGDFSRDQTRGVFAYFLADGYINQDHGDYAKAVWAADRWLTWIMLSGNRICPESKRSCELTVATHNMLYNVYGKLGIRPDYSRGDDALLIRQMYRSKWYYRWGFLAETRLLFLDELTRDKWYPRHLKSATLLLYRVMNMDPVTRRKRSKRMARVFGKAARRIYHGDPTNPLYRLFYEGATISLADDILKKYTSPTRPNALNGIHDWAWQRHTEERAWERSDGHDQIYLLNLFIAKANGRINW